MAKHPAWKKFETEVASLLGGRRYPANTGDRIDVTSDTVQAQCKLVRRISGTELARLAEEQERLAAGTLKTGIVAYKIRAGRGKHTPIMIALTAHEWARFFGEAPRLTTGALFPSDAGIKKKQ